MSVTRAHVLHAISIGDPSVEANVIRSITQQSLPLGIDLDSEATGGEVYPRFQAVRGVAPRLMFTTLDVAKILALVDFDGVSINSIAGADKLKAYLNKTVLGGTRAAGSAHKSFQAEHGLIVPRRLSCDHQGNASLSYEAFITDAAGDLGTDSALIISEAVALPAITAPTMLRHTLGPLSLTNRAGTGVVVYDHLKGFELDFGVDVVVEGSDSDLIGTYPWIRGIAPTVTFRGIDSDWLANTAAAIVATETTIPFQTDNDTNPGFCRSVIHTQSKFFLRKRLEGGTYVPDATAEHVKMTFKGLAYLENAFDVNGQDLNTMNLIIRAAFDNTNAPVAITLNQAIA